MQLMQRQCRLFFSTPPLIAFVACQHSLLRSVIPLFSATAHATVQMVDGCAFIELRCVPIVPDRSRWHHYEDGRSFAPVTPTVFSPKAD